MDCYIEKPFLPTGWEIIASTEDTIYMGKSSGEILIHTTINNLTNKGIQVFYIGPEEKQRAKEIRHEIKRVLGR